jgi:hypothetical protein
MDMKGVKPGDPDEQITQDQRGPRLPQDGHGAGNRTLDGLERGSRRHHRSGIVTQPPFPILLLTTTGARTGRPTTVPLGFGVDDRRRVFVVASKAGAPSHPAWFHTYGHTRR